MSKITVLKTWSCNVSSAGFGLGLDVKGLDYFGEKKGGDDSSYNGAKDIYCKKTAFWARDGG